MDMTYEEMLREMDAYYAASAAVSKTAARSLTRHEEMLERLCSGRRELEEDRLLAVLRKHFTTEEAELWLACPVFAPSKRPISHQELTEQLRPELRPRMDELTKKLLRHKILLRVKTPLGQGYFARCDEHSVCVLESLDVKKTAAAASTGAVKVVAELCVGCRLCTKTCPVHAVRMEGKLAVIDGASCMGCGACVRSCPKKALKL